MHQNSIVVSVVKYENINSYHGENWHAAGGRFDFVTAYCTRDRAAINVIVYKRMDYTLQLLFRFVLKCNQNKAHLLLICLTEARVLAQLAVSHYVIRVIGNEGGPSPSSKFRKVKALKAAKNLLILFL